MPFCATAQKEGNIWYFGFKAGLDFNTTPPSVIGGTINTGHGCGVICNKYGNLLFYSDGRFLIDKTHTMTPNGGTLPGGQNVSQPAIFIPHQDSGHIYYLFTSSVTSTHQYFSYTTIDTTLNGGKGDVRRSDTLMAEGCDKMHAVRHSNGKDVWVVTRTQLSNAFYAFLVTSAGVSHTPVISYAGQPEGTNPGTVGFMKFSPLGNKLAVTNSIANFAEIFDFDPSTGIVSNAIHTNFSVNYYGVEFSPSGRFLYLDESPTTTTRDIFQYDIKAGSAVDIIASRTSIAHFTSIPYLGTRALQLAPDGLIYSPIPSIQRLAAIKEPEKKGTASRYDTAALSIAPYRTLAGLQGTIASILFKPYIVLKAQHRACGNLTVDFSDSGDTNFIISSVWDFGDGTTATGIAVSKTYAAHGTYTVKNIISYKGPNPYTDTIKQTITTLQNPVAKIEWVEQVPCLTGTNSRFVFADSSKHLNGSKHKNNWWKFSDVSFAPSGISSVAKNYSQTGTYTVTLVVESTNQCRDTVTDTVRISPAAKASYVSLGEHCRNKNHFTPLQQSNVPTPGAITGYLWDFGDGTTSAQPSPQKIYSDTGKYKITFIAFEKNGCNDTATGSFTVLPSPKAGFTSGDVCFKDSSLFKNTSFITKGNLNYKWDFGDRNTTTVFEKNYLYADTGRYLVTLIAISDSLCTDTFEKEIYIKPKPIADFSANGSCTQSPVEFTDKSTRYTIPVKNNKWIFGDGNTGNSSADIQHIYTTQNQYLVKLVTEAAYGCKDSIVKPVFINAKPDVSLTITDDEQCLKGNRFEFQETHNLYGYPAKAVLWYFDNDPGITTFPNLLRSFTQTGLHTLKITIENDSGCWDSVIKNFMVHPQVKPDITINDTAQCEKGNIFTITNNSVVDGTGTINKYNWLFSDNATSTSILLLPKTFGTYGTHWAQCIMETDQGCLDTFRQNLEVYFSPAINFTVQNVCLGVEVIFDNITPDPNNKIIKWQWDFGDGGKSTFKSPGRKYSAAGNYLVNLIATTSDGCADTMEKFFPNLVSLRPTAYFEDSVLGSSGIKTMYRFTNGSTGATQYLWEFGDGTVSNDENPEKTFEDVGHFLVNLTAENQYGCKDQYSKKLFVVPDMEIIIPNAFTPNNRDDLNPVFKVEGLYLTKEFSMDIFNRWGERVYATDKVTTGWDGTYAGQASPPGMYMYVIRVMDLKNKVNVYYGSFALLR